MSSHNFEALRAAVISRSASGRWAEAVEEWQVESVEEDAQAEGTCVCGKTNLVYLYTIYNPGTDETLFPIGSSCINLFEVADLKSTVAVLRGLFDLRAAFAAGKRVTLDTEHFSRALLADLLQSGAFPANEYNRSNGENDYKFLLDMFNQRHAFTTKEAQKIWVLINRTIKPFVLADPRLG